MASRAKRSINFKALFSFAMAIVLVATMFCVPMVFTSAEGASTKSFVEIGPNAGGSSIVYYNKYDTLSRTGLRLVKNYFYMLTIDFKALSGTPEIKMEGKSGSSFVDMKTLCNSGNYSITDTEVGGITRKEIRIKAKAHVDEWKLTVGIKSGDSKSSVLVGEPYALRYTTSAYNKVSGDGTNLINGIGSEFIADAIKNGNDTNISWNLHYEAGKKGTFYYGTLLAKEYEDKFVSGTDKYMLTFLEGGQNVYAEYEDKTVSLTTGIYEFGCEFKNAGEYSDLELYTSSNGGSSYEPATVIGDDINAETNYRAIRFRVSGNVNAFKAIVGNKTDRTDSAFIFASPTLTSDAVTESLIKGLSSASCVYKSLSDGNDLEKWNIKTDAENSAAVLAEKYEKAKVLPEAESLKYENAANGGKQYVEYKDVNLEITAGMLYTFEADLRIMNGDLYSDTICTNNDPAFNVYVGTSTNTIKNDSNVVSKVDYDRQQGKLKITFNADTTVKGIRIVAGSTTASGTGSIRLANTSLTKSIEKTNNVEIVSTNLIANITSEDYNTDGSVANGSWSNIGGTAPKLTKIEEGDFLPAVGMIQINKGGSENRVEYIDNTTVLKAGTTYKFSTNYRVYSGVPTYKIGFKKIDGTLQSDYVFLNDKSTEVKNFVDEFNKETYTRSITFTPNTDMSSFKIVIGNEDPDDTGVSLAISNAKFTAVDKDGLALGASFVNNINDISIRRNSAQEKMWNMITKKDADAEEVFPIPDGTFLASQLIRIKEGTDWNRIVYTDDDVKFKAGKSYRCTIDYKQFSGDPTFSISDVKTSATTYTNYVDSKTSMRIMEFTMAKDVNSLFLTVGNSSGTKDVSMLFANPQLYEIDKDGNKIGENVLKDITKDTINDGMANGNKQKKWNLRYSGNKANALSIENIPDNYFRMGVLEIKNANGSAFQFSNVKPNTYYCFSYNVKNSGSAEPQAFVKFINQSAQFSNATLEYIQKDIDGEYNYYCEFKTPSNLANNENIQYGFTFGTNVDSFVSNVMLCELNSGMEPTNVNLAVNNCFNLASNLANYNNVPTANKWFFSGSVMGDIAIAERASSIFQQVNPSAYIISADNSKYMGEDFAGYYFTATAGSTYNYAFDLDYESNTHGAVTVAAEYKKDGGAKWCDFEGTITVDPSSNGNRQVGTITIPADVSTETKNNDVIKNVRLKVVFASKNDRGYITKGEIRNAANTATNLCCDDVTVGRTMALTVGETYDFSINLKYASPGYAGDTGIIFEYCNASGEWIKFPVTVSESATEYKRTATFTVPSAAATTGNNVRFKTLFRSQYTSGYLANAFVAEQGKSVNLLDNGDFTAGTSFWDVLGDHDKSSVCECPNGYFLKSYNKGNMMLYSDTAAWVKFTQNLTLKQNTYYKVVGEQVNPWGIDKDQDHDSVIAIQFSGADPVANTFNNSFNCYLSNSKDVGLDVSVLEAQEVKKNYTTKPITVAKFLYTNDQIKQLDYNGNCTFYLYMEASGAAGIWGNIAMYECDANGNILSGNVLINDNFNFGTFAWDKTGEFNSRLVKEPDNFFANYKTYDANMVVSNGTEENARLGQNIKVQKGKTYYLSAYYMNMNSAGITPKVIYTDKKGNQMEAVLTSTYSSDRYCYEATFTLPDDATTYRNEADVFVCIDNAQKGKGYLSTFRFCEEGSYESLFVNTDFSNGFAGWTTSGNYTLAPYDSSVFVFYYDDKKFDDGDWSGELATGGAGFTTGTIKGKVTDKSGSAVKNLTLILKPGNIKVKTNSKGEYTFENVKPGSYDIYVQTPAGTQIKAVSVDVRAGYVSTISDITFDVADDDDTTEIDTSDDEPTTGIIRGYLFDAYGYPLKGYTVYLGNEAKVVTGKKGAFEFSDVKPGKYDLYTKIDGEIVILKTVEISAGKGIIVKLRLPEEEESYLWLIILIAAGAVVVLGAGATLTTILLIKRKKKA